MLTLLVCPEIVETAKRVMMLPIMGQDAALRDADIGGIAGVNGNVKKLMSGLSGYEPNVHAFAPPDMDQGQSHGSLTDEATEFLNRQKRSLAQSPSDLFAVVRGDQDPSTADPLSLDEACPAFLRDVSEDRSLRLINLTTGAEFGAQDIVQVIAGFLQMSVSPHSFLLNNVATSESSPVDLFQGLESLQGQPSTGLYDQSNQFWVVAPPENNPHYQETIAELKRTPLTVQTPDLGSAAPSTLPPITIC